MERITEMNRTTTLKLLAALLAAVLALCALAACGKKTTTGEVPTAAPTEQQSESTVPTAESGLPTTGTPTEVPTETPTVSPTETPFELGDRLFDLNISEFVTIPDLKTLTIDKEAVAKSVEDEEASLIAHYRGTEKKTEGSVENGDLTYIYYKGILYAYRGEISFVLGESGIPGFDEKLASEGFTDGLFTAELEMPDDFKLPAFVGEDKNNLSSELQGKTVCVSFECDFEGKPAVGSELRGNLTLSHVFEGGTYDASSYYEIIKGEDDQKGYELEIGSGSFIEGFEEGMIGMPVAEGSKRNVPVVFPDPYLNNPAMSGVPADFEVTVVAVYRFVERDLDDPEDFAALKNDYELQNGKNSFPFENKEEFIADVTKQFTSQAAVGVYCDASTVLKDEEKVLADYVQMARDYYSNYYIRLYYSYTGMVLPEEQVVIAFFGSMDVYLENVEKAARAQMKNDLLLVALGEQEGFAEVTAEDYNAYLQKAADTENAYYESIGSEERLTPEEIEELMGGMRLAKLQMVLDRAEEWLVGYFTK